VTEIVFFDGLHAHHIDLVAVGVQQQAEDILRNCLTSNDISYSQLLSFPTTVALAMVLTI